MTEWALFWEIAVTMLVVTLVFTRIIWAWKKDDRLPAILIGVSIALMWGAGILIVYKVRHSMHYSPGEKEESVWDVILTHFDVTGILVGLAALIIAILIYLIVDKETQKHNHSLDGQIDILKTQIDILNQQNNRLHEGLFTLKNTTNEVKESLSALKHITGFKERLAAINKVIEGARTNHAELYILSYSPNYGKALLHNFKVILDEGGISDADLRHYNIYQGYKNLKLLREENEASLINCNDENPNKLHMAILRSEWTEPFGQDKFSHLLRERVLQRKEVLRLVRMDHKKSFPEKVKSPDYFMFPCDDALDDDPDERQKTIDDWIRKMADDDRPLINALKRENIISLDYVPIQFFLSIPVAGDEGYDAVIIFTNYYDVGEPHSVVCFSTNSKDMILGLRNMFEGLTASQAVADALSKPVRNIFGAKTPDKVLNFLIKHEIENPERRVGADRKYYQKAPVADIRSKDNLEQFFDSRNVPYSPNIEYIPYYPPDEKDYIKIVMDREARLKSLFSTGRRYISIGLFYNPVCEYVLQHTRLFQLVDPESTPSPSPSGETRKHICLQSQKFYETFFPDELLDYALIARLSVDKATIFIVGGVDFFGSENIVPCFANSRFQEYAGGLDQEMDFVAIFSVRRGTPVKVEMLASADIDKKKTVRSWSPSK